MAVHHLIITTSQAAAVAELIKEEIRIIRKAEIDDVDEEFLDEMEPLLSQLYDFINKAWGPEKNPSA